MVTLKAILTIALVQCGAWALLHQGGAQERRAAPPKPRRLLFIGVSSAPRHRGRRDEIRQSWMKIPSLKNWPAEYMQVKFVVGETRPGKQTERLEEEQALYGDILRLPVAEGYEQLPKKSVAFLRWFALNGSAKYVMKVDDDTFPDLWKIEVILRAKLLHGKNFVYGGGMLMHNRVLHVGKWAQSLDAYDQEFYPPYASGPAYVLGADLAKLLFDTHFALHSQRPLLQNEDANLGVWVERENRTTRVDYTHLKHEQDGCRKGVVLAMNLIPGTMTCMYERVLWDDGSICCGGAIGSWQERNLDTTA